MLTVWDLAYLAIQHSRSLLLYGPPGTGKSALAHHPNGHPIYSLNFSEDGIGSKLEGIWRPAKGDWEYVLGHGSRAWSNPGRLVIDELDRGSPDQISLMYRFLDSHEGAQITLPGGDTLTPHPEFQCVATMNGTPDSLPEALVDRFEVKLFINEPNPKAIARFPEKLRNMIAESCMKPIPEQRVGLRAWTAFFKLANKMRDEEGAAALVFGNRANDILAGVKLAMAE